MDAQELGLGCEALDDFRNSLDQIIRLVVDNLTERDLENGVVSAKIKITRQTQIDPAGRPVTALKLEPSVNMKIGAGGGVKCAAPGGIFMAYTRDGRPIISTKQVSLDEYIREVDGGGTLTA